MACSILLLIVSTVYEKSGTFVTGCKNYKKDTIIMLEAPNVLHYDPMPAIHMWGYSTTQLLCFLETSNDYAKLNLIGQSELNVQSDVASYP